MSLLGRSVVMCGVAALSAAAACGGHAVKDAPVSSYAELAEDGSDSNEVEARASAVTASLVLAPTATYVAGIVAAASDAPSFFLPRTCVTTSVATPASTSTTQTVVYVFDDCAGPWGLRRVTGTVTATLSETPASSVTIHVTSDALRLDGAVASVDATAVLTDTGIARDLAWTSTLIAGTTARGREFHRTASWHVGWQVGGSCVTVTNGSAAGDVLGRELTTTVDAYERCASECPAAGGSVVVDDVAAHESVAIDYDGTAVATVTTVPATATYAVDLDCVP
jgi:hypothetical protein